MFIQDPACIVEVRDDRIAGYLPAIGVSSGAFNLDREASQNGVRAHNLTVLGYVLGVWLTGFLSCRKAVRGWF